MPPLSKKKAREELISYVDAFGYHHSRWYCGITEKINQRLFGYHQVPENNHAYKYVELFSEKDTRDLEKELLALHFDGGSRGSDNPTFVYVYLKSPYTKE